MFDFNLAHRCIHHQSPIRHHPRCLNPYNLLRLTLFLSPRISCINTTVAVWSLYPAQIHPRFLTLSRPN